MFETLKFYCMSLKTFNSCWSFIIQAHNAVIKALVSEVLLIGGQVVFNRRSGYLVRLNRMVNSS